MGPVYEVKVLETQPDREEFGEKLGHQTVVLVQGPKLDKGSFFTYEGTPEGGAEDDGLCWMVASVDDVQFLRQTGLRKFEATDESFSDRSRSADPEFNNVDPYDYQAERDKGEFANLQDNCN